MKAICIDAGYKSNSGTNGGYAKNLVEGMIYTVIKIIPPFIDEEGYVLEEVKSSHPLGAFLASRFVPLSEIDEASMVRESLVEKCF